MGGGPNVVVRDIGPAHRDAWLARGQPARRFFPHRIVRLPKGGPDGLKLARRMVDPGTGPDQLWELVMYALPPVLDEIPAEAFFDDDLVWHQQQFGLPGQVATASIVERGRDLYVTTLVADVVQRIGRRRDLKTRVEKRFQGWPHLLLDAVVDFARDRGADRVLLTTTDWAVAHTDPAREVQRPLYERIYDGVVGPPRHAVQDGSFWALAVAANADVVLRPEVRTLPLDDEPQVCVCHDIERGWGHLEEPELAARADADAPGHLARMLEIEADAGVRATYSVVGFLVPELAERLRAGGHAVAFHSFDHAAAGDDGADDQLRQCRDLDYRIKGYRPARSRLTAELTDANLAFHNFEWLASSRVSLGRSSPWLANGIVRVPILFDDFGLHEGRAYDDWEAEGLRLLAGAPTAAFSLHDCYGSTWLDRYADLLAKVGELGRLRTVDEVAADVLLSHAV